MFTLADYAERLSTAIQLNSRLSSEGETVVKSLQEKLLELNAKLAPIHERATALTWAEENITRTKAETNELLQHIEASRKVESVLRMGPGRTEAQLEPYLSALGRLEEALSHLEAHMEGGGAEAVQQAYDDALALHDRAMRDCEADFAAVLAQHGAARLPSAAWLTERTAPENLRASLSLPELELLPAPATARVSRLAEVMLRARHVTCLDTYAQARGRALDMLLALVGLDPSSLLPAGLALQSADQLQRLVGSWAQQLRVLLVGAAAELALAQDIWPSPYDEVTFSETISRSLRLVLQVGKAVCEGRGSGGSPDRLFVLLQMHQSLMDLLPYIDDLLSSRERCTGLLNEAHVLGVMIGRMARQIFSDFEEGVGSRGSGGQGGGSSGLGNEAVAKLTMLDGTVHPICATTLSFLKRLFTYPNALTLLFSSTVTSGGGGGGGAGGSITEAMTSAAAAAASSSIMRILMRLLEVLEAKAKAYKVPALGDLFLMNNVHYMVWTVEQAAAVDKQQRSFTSPLPSAATRPKPAGGGGKDAAAAAAATTTTAAGGKAAAAAATTAAAAGSGDDSDGGAAAVKRRGGGAKGRAAAAVATPDDDDISLIDVDDGDVAAVLPPAAVAAGRAGGSVLSGAAAPPPGGGLAVLGHAWVERHKDIVEHYGAEYHEKSWRPLITLLEGVLVTGEDVEPADPGRFKAWVKTKFSKINTHLDGIMKQQASWTIPDSKLKTAVRNVIKQDVLPLYGEFWERYTAVEFTTHPEKYLRYPPEQLEHLIHHTLFEGRAAAAPRGSGPPGVGSGGSQVAPSVSSLVRWSVPGPPSSHRSSAPPGAGAGPSRTGLSVVVQGAGRTGGGPGRR